MSRYLGRADRIDRRLRAEDADPDNPNPRSWGQQSCTTCLLGLMVIVCGMGGTIAAILAGFTLDPVLAVAFGQPHDYGFVDFLPALGLGGGGIALLGWLVLRNRDRRRYAVGGRVDLPGSPAGRIHEGDGTD